MSDEITTLTIIGVLGVIWVGCLLGKRYRDYITYDKKVTCIHCDTSVPRKSLYGEYCSQECYESTPEYLEAVEARKEEELQLQVTRAERRIQEESAANLSQWNTLTGIKYQHDKQNDFSEPFCNLVRGLLSTPEDFNITVMISEVSSWGYMFRREQVKYIPSNLLKYMTYNTLKNGSYSRDEYTEGYSYLDVECYLYNLHKLPLSDFYLKGFQVKVIHNLSQDNHTLDIAGSHTKEDTWLTAEERSYLLSNVIPEYVKNYLDNKDQVEQLAKTLSNKYNDKRYKRDTLFMLDNNPFVKVETILARVPKWASMYAEEDETKRILAVEQKALEDKEVREKQIIADQKRDKLKAVYKTYE